MKGNRTIIAVLSDTHGGHILGLCNPETELKEIDNGEIRTYYPQLSETQKFMWETLEWGKDKILKLAGKDNIILIHDGDPTHGKASFLQTMSSQMSDQIIIACMNFDTWLQYKNVKTVRLAVGTGIHEMGEGSASTLIMEALKGKYPKLDIEVVYHGVLDVGGFLIDYAHHGPNKGIRTWTEGNGLRLYLQSVMMSSLMAGKPPADLYLRGHYHTYKKETLEIITEDGKCYESCIVLLPGFTFKDDYTRQATKSEYIQTVGMVAFEVLDGHLYKTHRYVRYVDIRTREIF